MASKRKNKGRRKYQDGDKVVVGGYEFTVFGYHYPSMAYGLYRSDGLCYPARDDEFETSYAPPIISSIRSEGKQNVGEIAASGALSEMRHENRKEKTEQDPVASLAERMLAAEKKKSPGLKSVHRVLDDVWDR